MVASSSCLLVAACVLALATALPASWLDGSTDGGAPFETATDAFDGAFDGAFGQQQIHEAEFGPLDMETSEKQAVDIMQGGDDVQTTSRISWHNMGGEFHNRPIVVSGNSDLLEVHCSTIDNRMWRRVLQNGHSWSEWESTGPDYFSYREPAVIAHPNGDLDRFSVWRYYKLSMQSMRKGAWQDWGLVDMITPMNPWGVALPDDKVAVFVRGADNSFRYMMKIGKTVSAWGSMGGSFIYKPSGFANYDASMVYVLAVDIYHHVHWTWFHNGHWEPWTDMGVQSMCAPETAAYQNGFAVATCDPSGSVKITTFSFTTRKWGSWVDIGGIISSVPAITEHKNHITVFARGLDNDLYVYEYGKRKKWLKVPGVTQLTGAPGVVNRGGRLELFVIQKSTNLTHVTIHS